MKLIDMHIEIVSSTRKGFSSMSLRSREAIFEVLVKRYTHVTITIINNLEDLEALVDRRPDLVFLGMNYVSLNHDLGLQDPEMIWITDYLDTHDITYTGSGQTAHDLEHSKPLAKQCALGSGLATSPFFVVKHSQSQIIDKMPINFPVFIKPSDRGGGLGIDNYSVAYNFDQINSKVQSIAIKYKSDSLIEEYLPGREFSVAILKDEDSQEYSVMPAELIAVPNENGLRILSGKNKSSNTGRVIEITDQEIKAKVTKLAINIFHALGARDYGRIDIRLDKNGTPNFLEANLFPCLISGYGSFPQACVVNKNLSFDSVITKIVNLALIRKSNLFEYSTRPSITGIQAFQEPVFETA